jgi:hypothetical protein
VLTLVDQLPEALQNTVSGSDPALRCRGVGLLACIFLACFWSVVWLNSSFSCADMMLDNRQRSNPPARSATAATTSSWSEAEAWRDDRSSSTNGPLMKMPPAVNASCTSRGPISVSAGVADAVTNGAHVCLAGSLPRVLDQYSLTRNAAVVRETTPPT